MLNKQGKLIVISAPSGGGKSTIIKRLFNKFDSLQFSISATTRSPRGTEQNGIEYFFFSKQEFTSMIDKGDFLEYKIVHDNYYGTLREPIMKALNAQKNVILDIDTQGALAIKEIFPEAITIFIYPPSISELKRRLTFRGTDTTKVIEVRLQNAIQEIGKKEMYDYQVENRDLDLAVTNISEIFMKYNIT